MFHEYCVYMLWLTYTLYWISLQIKIHNLRSMFSWEDTPSSSWTLISFKRISLHTLLTYSFYVVVLRNRPYSCTCTFNIIIPHTDNFPKILHFIFFNNPTYVYYSFNSIGRYRPTLSLIYRSFSLVLWYVFVNYILEIINLSII